MAKSATLKLSEHITDENQQVFATIVSAKVADGKDGDLFDVEVEFADGSAGEGEVIASGGQLKKDDKVKLQLEKRTVTKKGKKGEDDTEEEVSVVVAYRE